jgi:cytochrome c556
LPIPSPSSAPSRSHATPLLEPCRSLCSIALGALLALLASGAAQAADDKAWIDYRQELMESIGDHMAGIGDILKNEMPLIPSIEFHANAIAQSARLIGPAFQHKVVAGPTDAKPEIWSDPVKFEKASAKLQSEAELLAATVAKGPPDAIPKQVKALGEACGGCHKSFRKPKEESYKNKK